MRGNEREISVYDKRYVLRKLDNVLNNRDPNFTTPFVIIDALDVVCGSMEILRRVFFMSILRTGMT